MYVLSSLVICSVNALLPFWPDGQEEHERQIHVQSIMESSSHQGDLMANTHIFISVGIYLFLVRKCCSCLS